MGAFALVFPGVSVLVVAPLDSAALLLFVNFAINYFAIKMYEILQQWCGWERGREKSRDDHDDDGAKKEKSLAEKIDINFSVSRVII